MGLSRWVGVCVSMHTHIHVPPHTHMYPHTHMHPQDGWSPILPSGINISGSHGNLTTFLWLQSHSLRLFQIIFPCSISVLND